MENRIKDLETMVGLLESRLQETRKELFQQKQIVRNLLGADVSIADQFDDVEDFYYHKGQSFFDGNFFHQN